MTISTLQTTYFASAERADDEELERSIRYFVDHPEQFKVLDTVPDAVLILNEHRQVVYANRALADLQGIDDTSLFHGMRPGELLGCAHADEHSGGCGTARNCALCGAPRAILASLDGKRSVEECRISQRSPGDALDLRIFASPFTAENRRFSIIIVRDIANEKRRRALERIFFHDILNTAGGLQGYTELLRDSEYEELETMGFRDVLPRLARQLVDEISAQRLLLHAENGRIELQIEDIDPTELLREIADTYAMHQTAENRAIRVRLGGTPGAIRSDRTLLSRVIGNMTKNALEACGEGETVTLTVDASDSWITFGVHNPGFIPTEIQLQLFERSFSTKGSGRGLGTYSIQLLGERYLKGEVGFRSTEDDGTTFRIVLPRQFDKN